MNANKAKAVRVDVYCSKMSFAEWLVEYRKTQSHKRNSCMQGDKYILS